MTGFKVKVETLIPLICGRIVWYIFILSEWFSIVWGMGYFCPIFWRFCSVWTFEPHQANTWPSGHMPTANAQSDQCSCFLFTESLDIVEYFTITKTWLFKYTETFTTKKKENFQIKNSDILHVSVYNIDCGYSLEPPHRCGSNRYPQSMVLSRNK